MTTETQRYQRKWD